MAYKSRYEEQLANALGKITNREKFQYDFNADPMYQTYKDQYVKLGNEAAANAAANVSALTGGYGNSYATTAAAQANQQYLTKLNEQIPTLYQQALAKYQMEGDELNNAYSILSDAENRDYTKYRDQVADEQWQKNYEMALNQFNESQKASSGGSGGGNNSQLSSLMPEIQKQASILRNSSKNAAGVPTYFSNYLKGLISNGSITQDEANALMEDFMAKKI